MLDFLFNAAVLGFGVKHSASFKSGMALSFGANIDSGISYSGREGATGKEAAKQQRLVGKSGNTHNVSMFGERATVGTNTNQRFSGFKTMQSGRFLSMGTGLIPLAFSGYFIYDGYKENGIKGASDALIFDAAVGLGTLSGVKDVMVQDNYSRSINALSAGEKNALRQAGVDISKLGGDEKLKFTNTRLSGMRFMGKGLAAGIGGSIGQAIGGTPGAFAGAFLAAKVPTPVTLGLAAAGAIATMGTKAIVQRGATILKKGYERRAMRRRIDTAGDTAAFFTRNANTMRSRAVLSMRNSHLNARSALGMEASFTHMNRDYFSPYR
jgi:hypothetical protein